jgi:predicted transcriptional regulator
MQDHYRDKFDIIASILDVANNKGVRQAKILNKVKIPHGIFKEYLLFLYQHDLIEIENIHHQKTYRTTTKGVHFLSICNEMKTLT